MDNTTQVLTILLLLVAFVGLITALLQVRRKRHAFPVRAIPAFENLPLMIGAAIEANRPVHISAGSAGLGDNSTLLTLASAELFYRAGQWAAIGATSPVISSSNSTAIPLAYGTLHRAYQSRNKLANYQAGSVRWLPAGPRSMAFAAAATAMMGIEQINTNLMVGSFGPELALIADSAARHNQNLIAASDQLEGQAIAYATSDHPLIGEEIFAAGSYMSDEPEHKAALVTQDMLRWLVIGALVLLTVIRANSEIATTIGRLLTGAGIGGAP